MCVSVCVGAGARLMSTEQQLFFPSENVQANPNRPALNAAAPHPGLRVDKLHRVQSSSQRNHCRDCTCKGRNKLTA